MNEILEINCFRGIQNFVKNKPVKKHFVNFLKKCRNLQKKLFVVVLYIYEIETFKIFVL